MHIKQTSSNGAITASLEKTIGFENVFIVRGRGLIRLDQLRIIFDKVKLELVKRKGATIAGTSGESVIQLKKKRLHHNHPA